jgi:regulator of sigma E protease
MLILTIIVFIVILGLLIFVHEAGHFIAAKIAKVKVDEFAFGFPPRIVSYKRGETRYSINAIPLGGYVKLYGEEEEIKQPHSFFGRPVGWRIFIVTTGVLMNFILAIILMTIGFTIGMTPLVSDPTTMSGIKKSQVMIVYVEPNSAAAKIGLAQGDILNGFSSTTDLQQFTQAHIGQTVNLSVTQGNKTENLTTQLSSDKTAPLGVGIVSITTVKQNVLTAFWTSIKETGKVIAALFVFLWTIIKSVFTTGHAGPAAEGVVGPVGLFNFTSQALKIGWIYVLQLVALLSINLGIINILPFPALDGGKVLFLALEGIFKRKVVRQEVENIIHLVGFGLLIILILAITYRDIVNLR